MHSDKNSNPAQKVYLPYDTKPHMMSDIEWWYSFSFLNTGMEKKYAVMVSFFRAGLIPFFKGSYLLFLLADLDEESYLNCSLLDKKLLLNMNLFLFPSYIICLPKDKNIHRIYKDYRKHKINPPHNLMKCSSIRKRPLRLLYGKNYMQYLNETTGQFELMLNECGMKINLTFNPLKPAAFIGGDGKPNQLYYYSYTDCDVEGYIIGEDSKDKVRGKGWFDHQWGNARGLLTSTGWNWFGIQLDDSRELMVTELVSRIRCETYLSSANLIEKDGLLKHTENVSMEPKEYWISPSTNAYYPISWHISIPEFSIELEVNPILKCTEIPSPFPLQRIWEGPCTVSGFETKPDGSKKPLSGRCFMELVGYANY